MKLGDLVTIWNGESDIRDPKNFLVGVIVKQKFKEMLIDGGPVHHEPKFQVLWNIGGADPTWYNVYDLESFTPEPG